MNEKLFLWAQYCLPQHLVSRMVGWLGKTEIPSIKNAFIRWFIEKYQVNMQEALLPTAESYRSFNAFFTRALKPSARPVDHKATLVSPADGIITQHGLIQDATLLQAKGQTYALNHLLAGDAEKTALFSAGSYSTLYLSPKDYHRVHMPMAGTLTKMVYVPGKLFSVNTLSAACIPEIFARNERAICYFDTEQGGMAVILIGAMIVASIHTVWAGQVCPLGGLKTIAYQPEKIFLRQGDELGHFCLGSSVIVLTEKAMEFPFFTENQPIQMGEKLAHV